MYTMANIKKKKNQYVKEITVLNKSFLSFVSHLGTFL